MKSYVSSSITTVMLTALTASATVIDNFEGNGIGTWSVGSSASYEIIEDPAQQGNHLLKLTITMVSGNWQNYLQIDFSTPQDWSTASQIALSIRPDANFPNSSYGAIGVYWYDNGAQQQPNSYPINRLSPDVDNQVTVLLYKSSTGNDPAMHDSVTSLRFYFNNTYFTNNLALPSGTTFTFYIDNITVNTAAVPEPSGAALLLPGIGALALFRKSY